MFETNVGDGMEQLFQDAWRILLLDWWGRFDGIMAEMSLVGIIKENDEKKAKAMTLIRDEYATLAEYLG